MTLLLRHPDVFGRAAAFDAPLMLNRDKPVGWGPIKVLPDKASFAPYEIPDLLRKRAGEMKSSRRLILSGYCVFAEDMQKANDLLHELGIPHEYRQGRPAGRHVCTGQPARGDPEARAEADSPGGFLAGGTRLPGVRRRLLLASAVVVTRAVAGRSCLYADGIAGYNAAGMDGWRACRRA